MRNWLLPQLLVDQKIMEHSFLEFKECQNPPDFMHLRKHAYNKIVCIKNIFLIPLLKKIHTRHYGNSPGTSKY